MLERIKKWINYQIKTIQVSDNDPLLAKISNLEGELEELDDENTLLYSDMQILEGEVAGLTEELADNNKHSSLENYKDWLLQNLAPKSKYYDYGTGRKRVHTIFEESLKDEDEIREFMKKDFPFSGFIYETADDMVYAFNTALSKKFPTARYYASDDTLYGTMEYWATAKETIAKLRKGGKSFDCDDSMTLRYSCLYYLLKDFFPKELWRLRGIIVDIWTGGGHALLSWVKEGVNDWIPIETTFYDGRMDDIWNKEYRIRDQMLYQIRYSFDNKAEYVK